MRITGIILAGGLARRMGGTEKAMVKFRGTPMVVHVINRLKPQVDEIFINANRETDRYAALGYPVIQDDITGFAGPLAGLHSGMLAASQPFILTVPCDSPLLPMDLGRRLLAGLLEKNADLAVARSRDRTHPVFCLCRSTLLPNLENFLQNGGRKVEAWHAALNTVEVLFDENPQAFANINTLEELRELEKSA